MPKAFGFTAYGGPETQQFLDLDVPHVTPGHLLVRVRVAAVNPIDFKVRSGMFAGGMSVQFPAVMGTALSGDVAAVGEDVTGFAVGDAVFGTMNLLGAYAEYALLPAKDAALLPAGVSHEAAATLPVAAVAAINAVIQLDIADGQTLAITGAAGGVGSATAQLAGGRGVRVLGVVDETKVAAIEALGATAVLSGDGVADRLRAAAPDGVDALFDLVGGDLLRAVVPVVRDPARVVSSVDPSVADLGGQMLAHIDNATALRRLGEAVADGSFRPVISSRFPLAEAAEAVAAVENGQATGKVVILIHPV